MFSNLNLNWLKPKPKKTEVVIVHRLSPEAYEKLSNLLEGPYVNANTTDGQAHYRLGIQQTLKLLREGFVVGT